MNLLDKAHTASVKVKRDVRRVKWVLRIILVGIMSFVMVVWLDFIMRLSN